MLLHIPHIFMFPHILAHRQKILDVSFSGGGEGAALFRFFVHKILWQV